MHAEEMTQQEKHRSILTVGAASFFEEARQAAYEGCCKVTGPFDGSSVLAAITDAHAELLLIHACSQERIALIRQVHAAHDALPILAVLDEGDSAEALDAGAAAVLRRPYAEDSLGRAVSRLLFADQLAQRIHRYQQMFDQNPIPLMLYRLEADEHGRYSSYTIAYCSPAAASLLQIEPNSVTGKRMSRFSEKKMNYLLRANQHSGQQHEVHFDSHCSKYLDLTAYRETEGYVAFVMIDVTEQIRQSELARQERDKYSHLLDAIRSGIAVFNIHRGQKVTLEYFNDTICTLTGYTREELTAQGPEGICRAIPEDLPSAFAQANRAIRELRPLEVAYCCHMKNGEPRYLRARFSMEKTGDDTLTAYVVYTDNTVQHQLQAAMASEMAYLQEAQGANLLAKCRADITYGVVDNYVITGEEHTTAGQYAQMVDAIAQRCATRQMADYFVAHMRPEALQQAYAEGRHEVALEYLRRAGNHLPLWVRTTVKLFADPETHHIMCFMYTYNIDREKTMQLIVEHVSATEFETMGLLYINSDILHIVHRSDMEKAMDCEEDVRYSETTPAFADLYFAPELREEAKAKLQLDAALAALAEKPVYSVSYPIKFLGQTMWKRWEFSYLDDSREIIIFTRSDVTPLFLEQEAQRENLRNALMLAEHASHAKTDFLSHMSHEIRTPMNAIIGMSTLAAQCVNDPKQVSECIAKVGISARFLLSLINDILDMSRIESGKVVLRSEKFFFDELVSAINTIIYAQAKDKGVDYECVLTSFTYPAYVGDAMKLQQVLVNLLGNAIKFTAPGGKVQFIIHQDKVEKNTASMTFTVNDTGIGISEQFQKHIFEPFEQEDHGSTAVYQGSGLGLAICRNLVDIMGGSISVNSIEGIGSEFTVSVPLELCEDEKPYVGGEDIPFEKLSALIVDDDVLICEHTQSILREMGMCAEWVSGGRQAIELVRSRKLKQSFFNIILLDWKMPDLNGIETARQIRQIVGPDVTIIVITAYDWSSIEQEAKAAGVNLLITKPLFKSTLMSAFHRVFSEKAQQEENPQQKEFDFTGRRVLLVEDHILNIEVAKRLLESKHARVDVAENGLRAIEMFAKAPDYSYDAILMDVRMPVMDGLTAARSIRQLSNQGAASIPIIAMSANAFDEDVEKSRAAGMNAHLPKPIEPQVLFSVLERYFEAGYGR